MAFDRTNPIHLQALKDEQANDPINMGYAAVDGQTAATVSLFNTVDSNVVPTSGADFITAKDLVLMIFIAAVNSQDQFTIQSLLEVTSDLNSDISDFRLQLIDMSGTFSTEILAKTRLLSRAEVLFADVDSNGVTERVYLSTQDWYAARDFVGV